MLVALILNAIMPIDESHNVNYRVFIVMLCVVNLSVVFFTVS